MFEEDKLIFGTVDGKVIGKLGSVNEIELTVDESESRKLFTDKTYEASVKFNCDPFRAFLPQGMYNAYVLKRDGYLSPDNGWFGDEEDTIL